MSTDNNNSNEITGDVPVEIPRILTMEKIKLLTPPNMISSYAPPTTRIRVNPPILLPVPRYEPLADDVPLGSSSDNYHPPEPTTGGGVFKRRKPSKPIPKVGSVPNDPGKIKKPTKRGVNLKKTDQVRKFALHVAPQSVPLPPTLFAYPPNLYPTPFQFYPQDPHPMTINNQPLHSSIQNKNNTSKTYLDL